MIKRARFPMNMTKYHFMLVRIVLLICFTFLVKRTAFAIVAPGLWEVQESPRSLERPMPQTKKIYLKLLELTLPALSRQELSDPVKVLEFHKMRLQQMVAEWQYFLQQNQELAVYDPVTFHFHRIRLNRALILCEMRIYEKEQALVRGNRSATPLENIELDQVRNKQIGQMEKLIKKQKLLYHLVEGQWLDHQDFATNLAYNKLKATFPGGGDCLP